MADDGLEHFATNNPEVMDMYVALKLTLFAEIGDEDEKSTAHHINRVDTFITVYRQVRNAREEKNQQ